MTGDCSVLLPGPYVAYQHIAASAITTYHVVWIQHTARISAPFCPVPFDIATALPPRFASDFARFTSWLEPNVSCAGRLGPDIAIVNWWALDWRILAGGSVHRVSRALVNFLEADLRQAIHEIHRGLP